MKSGSVTFSVSSSIYSKDIIYKACYAFIDRAYIFLDDPRKNSTEVTLKWKKAFSQKKAAELEGEFTNELLNALVRESVSRQNKKVVEQIVGGAMASSLGLGRQSEQAETGVGCKDERRKKDEEREAKEIEEAVEALKRELAAIESSDDYENDELGIREILVSSSELEIAGPKKSDTKTVNKQKNNGKGKKN